MKTFNIKGDYSQPIEILKHTSFLVLMELDLDLVSRFVLCLLKDYPFCLLFLLHLLLTVLGDGKFHRGFFCSCLLSLINSKTDLLLIFVSVEIHGMLFVSELIEQ
jgi:hypothetical protein